MALPLTYELGDDLRTQQHRQRIGLSADGLSERPAAAAALQADLVSLVKALQPCERRGTALRTNRKFAWVYGTCRTRRSVPPAIPIGSQAIAANDEAQSICGHVPLPRLPISRG